ncbi:MAG: TetR/AcrR family transcriptional regulator [Sneathiella sp.]
MTYNKSIQTRKNLIKATAGLLRSKGYSAMGLSEVVKNSSVPKGSLYHHFPGGKEELASVTILETGENMAQSVMVLSKNSKDIVETVGHYFNHYIEQLEKTEFQNGCPLATTALETATLTDTVQKACSTSFLRFEDILASQLKESGLPDEIAQKASIYTIAAFEGGLLLAKAHNDTHYLTVVRDQITQHLKTIIQ